MMMVDVVGDNANWYNDDNNVNNNSRGRCVSTGRFVTIIASDTGGGGCYVNIMECVARS